MAVFEEALTNEHPAGEAFNRAARVVRELPGEPTPGELLDWCVAVRESVATLCEGVPGGSATQPALALCILVARGPKTSGTIANGGATRDPRPIFGTGVAEVEAYREDLESALIVLNDRMQRDISGALKAVLGTLEPLSDDDVASLLDVDVETVGKWRDSRPGWVHPTRVIVIARLLTVLLLKRRPNEAPRLDWFREPSEELDGRRPIDLLDEDPWAHREALIRVAKTSR